MRTWERNCIRQSPIVQDITCQSSCLLKDSYTMASLLVSAVCTVPLQPTLLVMISAKASAVAVAVTGLHKAAWIACTAAVELPAIKAFLACVAIAFAEVLELVLA